jgi:hypothetical protein
MAFQIVGLVSDAGTMLRRLQEAVNALGSGRSNAIGSVTLTASSATTTVTDRRAGIDSVIALMPVTANAASALASTWVSARGVGGFTLSHANNAETDRDFRYLIQG